jgi:hypothetical protein
MSVLNIVFSHFTVGPSWSWSYGSWSYDYQCNQCLSPLKWWVRTLFMARCTDTILCDKVCQWLATGQWVSPGTPVSSINKTNRHYITEILLKVALNTIKPNQTKPISLLLVIPGKKCEESTMIKCKRVETKWESCIN